MIAAAQAALAAAGDATVAAGKAAYFKHVCQFYGVKTPAVEVIFKEHIGARLSAPVACETARALLATNYHEMKQLGVLTLWENKKVVTATAPARRQVLDCMEAAYDAGHVADWATSDGVCGRVLAEVIKADHADAGVLDRVCGWRTSDNIWKRRSAAVAFVKLAAPSWGLHDRIVGVCSDAVRHPERFVQLGVGWVLRELSLHDRPRVMAFLRDHAAHISREGLRYAIEKMGAADRAEMLAYRPGVAAAAAGGAAVGGVAAGAGAAGAAAASAGAASAAGGVAVSGRKRKRSEMPSSSSAAAEMA